MPATVIAHLTDSHTTSLHGVSARSLVSKRALGYLSWRRKRRYRHSQKMLEAATDAALKLHPDALVFTGDLLHVGLVQEMREIRPWLATLAERLPVLLVPGNHDLYTQDSVSAWSEELGDLPVFGEALSAEHEWPRALQVNNVRVVGLSSAYPAPLARADGRLGTTQLRLLDKLLSDTPGQANRTLLALHHPADQNLSEERKSLLDADQLQSLIKTHAPAALVHGHLHKNLSYQVATTPCYCTASASSTYPEAMASFRMLSFEENGLKSCQLYEADNSDQPKFQRRHLGTSD